MCGRPLVPSVIDVVLSQSGEVAKRYAELAESNQKMEVRFHICAESCIVVTNPIMFRRLN